VRRGLKYATSEPINRPTGEKPPPRFGRIYFADLAQRPADPKAPRGLRRRNASALKTDPLYLYIEVNHLPYIRNPEMSGREREREREREGESVSLIGFWIFVANFVVIILYILHYNWS